jgi:hypothetical protein
MVEDYYPRVRRTEDFLSSASLRIVVLDSSRVIGRKKNFILPIDFHPPSVTIRA